MWRAPLHACLDLIKTGGGDARDQKTVNMGAMKAVSVITVSLLLLANAFALALASNGFVALAAAAAVLPYVLIATLALGVIALVTILAARTPAGGNRAAATPALPVAAPTKAPQADAEIVGFLATLQAKGRLVDFAMGDINAYNDAQVGAAARVVHAGIKSVLDEHFRIRPVQDGAEQSAVQVPANYPADEYRLLGKISGQPPFSGTLVHHGWKTDVVKLPTILRGSTDRLPVIAPAEVELK